MVHVRFPKLGEACTAFYNQPGEKVTIGVVSVTELRAPADPELVECGRGMRARGGGPLSAGRGGFQADSGGEKRTYLKKSLLRRTLNEVVYEQNVR